MNPSDESQNWKTGREKTPLRRNTPAWLFYFIAPPLLYLISAAVVRAYLGNTAKQGVIVSWALLLTLLVLGGISVAVSMIHLRRTTADSPAPPRPPRPPRRNHKAP